MSTAEQKIDRGDKLPWAILCAGVVAMAAMYCTRGRFNGLFFTAAALVASRFTAWRLPNARIISWGIRLIILVVVISMFNAHSSIDTTVWYLNEEDTKVAGFAFALELVLRVWERRAMDRERESRGIAVLMTALIYTAATHTYERTAIQIITPIYIILVLLSLRSFARIGQPAAVVRSSRWELVAMRVLIALLAVTIALAATSLVTRYEYQVTSWAAQVLIRKHSKSADIGFSMDPQLGEVSNPQPTMDRILLIDGPPTEEHLRVMAFDTYSKRRWLPSMTDRAFSPAALAREEKSAPSRHLQFKRVSDTAGLLPVPLEAQKIDVQVAVEEDDLASLRDVQADYNPNYDVAIQSAPEFQGPLCVAPDDALRQRLLAIPPEIDPKVIELAKQIAGNGDKSLQLIRIQSSLRSQHAYSLSFSPQGEPLNDFILNNRSAHCQYFASAMVVMARAVGIPARYVSGFYAHERYGDNQMVVRSRDAHAWAECWIDGVGWMTVDATASGGRPDEIYKDPSAWKRWWEKLTDLPGEIRTWISGGSPAVKMYCGVAVTVIAAAYILRKILRRRERPKSSQDRYAQPGEELLALGRRFEKWLRTQRKACPPQLTWSDHLSAEALSAESALFVRAYNQARFGDDPTFIAKAKELLHKLETKTDSNST